MLRTLLLAAALLLPTLAAPGCGIMQVLRDASAIREELVATSSTISRLEAELASRETWEPGEREALEDRVKGLQAAAETSAALYDRKLEEVREEISAAAEKVETTATVVGGVAELAGTFGIPGAAGIGMAASALLGFLRSRRRL